MKIAVCCLLFALVVAVSAFPQRSQSSLRQKRGFRSGAADRFSHGFGKRTDEFRGLLTVQNMADVIRSSEKAALAFVEKYMDLNGDGYITPDEVLLDSSEQ